MRPKEQRCYTKWNPFPYNYKSQVYDLNINLMLTFLQSKLHFPLYISHTRESATLAKRDFRKCHSQKINLLVKIFSSPILFLQFTISLQNQTSTKSWRSLKCIAIKHRQCLKGLVREGTFPQIKTAYT